MEKLNKIKYLVFLPLLTAIAAPAGAVGSLADVTVYDRMENRTLPIHHHNGRYYVVGKPGNEYQIRIANRARNEVLSVVSVDGVNAVSGDTANWNQTGYVLGGYQAFDIRGWRKSMDRIAAFYFTEHHNSYAARTGRPNNVGVIGVALFRKKFEPPVRIEPPVLPKPPVRPMQRYDSDSPFPSGNEGAASRAPMDSARAESAAPATAMAENAPGAMKDRAAEAERYAPVPRPSPSLGTGHGRSETSQVTYTNFERASATPAEVITIHYDTYENLLAQGVITQPPLYARPAPTPFPGQFVPDPR